MINEEGANKVISEMCCLQIELGCVEKLRLKARILPRIRQVIFKKTPTEFRKDILEDNTGHSSIF